MKLKLVLSAGLGALALAAGRLQRSSGTRRPEVQSIAMAASGIAQVTWKRHKHCYWHPGYRHCYWGHRHYWGYRDYGWHRGTTTRIGE
jgi:hypothetical protein